MSNTLERREFLKALAAAGAGLGLGGCGASAAPAAPSAAVLPAPSPTLFQAPPLQRVRVGFVGVGHQGSDHIPNFLGIDGVDITAICDLVPAKVEAAQKRVTDAGRPKPAGYSGGPDDYRRMCDEQDLDLVFTATPWELHAPVMLAAMRAGKHAATEVPMAVSLDELWELVQTAETTRRHCVMMENCCYDRTEMMILNMVRQGLFGELLHAECGYLHDIRGEKLTDYYEGRWRVKHSIAHNGDLYPTHGVGPVAQWLNINRGNRFDFLVSMGGNSRGLNLWAAEHLGVGSPEALQRYALSDVVTNLIRTVAGQTIVVTHNTSSPRPYSRNIALQGTKGLVRKYPNELIYVEGRSPGWEDLGAYRAQYDHPLWKSLESASAGAGHGGMDYIEDFRLIQNLRAGAALDNDVYDGAVWPSIRMLSEQSIADRSRPQDFPDFTRGAWTLRPPVDIQV